MPRSRRYFAMQRLLRTMTRGTLRSCQRSWNRTRVFRSERNPLPLSHAARLRVAPTVAGTSCGTAPSAVSVEKSTLSWKKKSTTFNLPCHGGFMLMPDSAKCWWVVSLVQPCSVAATLFVGCSRPWVEVPSPARSPLII